MLRFVKSNALLVVVSIGALIAVAASTAFMFLLAWPVEPVTVEKVIMYERETCPREQLSAGLVDMQRDGFEVTRVNYRSEWLSMTDEPAGSGLQNILPAGDVTLTENYPHFEAVRTLPGVVSAPIIPGVWRLRVTVSVDYSWHGVHRTQPAIVRFADDELKVSYDGC